MKKKNKLLVLEDLSDEVSKLLAENQKYKLLLSQLKWRPRVLLQQQQNGSRSLRQRNNMIDNSPASTTATTKSTGLCAELSGLQTKLEHAALSISLTTVVIATSRYNCFNKQISTTFIGNGLFIFPLLACLECCDRKQQERNVLGKECCDRKQQQ